jgi:hypothetical protein
MLGYPDTVRYEQSCYVVYVAERGVGHALSIASTQRGSPL